MIAGVTERFRSDERLLVICGSTVLVMAGQGVVGPILPLFARDFGVSAAIVGLTFTAFGLARLLLNIPAGIWADRRGRRFLLIGGPLITAVGMLGSGLAPTIETLLAWRFVAGAGSALYMTGAQIYLVDIAAPAERGRYIATNQAALLIGLSTGPAIGGLVAGSFGLRAPFLVVGCAALLTAVYGWFRLPETGGRGRATTDRAVPPGRPSGKTGPVDDRDPAPNPPIGQAGSVDDRDPAPKRRFGWPAGAGAFFGSRQFVAVGLVTMSIFAIRGSRQTLVPLYANEEFGFDSGTIGLIFAAIGIVGLILVAPAGWLADNAGRKPMIVVAGFLAAIGTAAAAFAPSGGLFVAALLFSALGTSISGPAPAAFVADIAPEELRGSAMGTYRTWGDLGVVLAPPLSGALADVTSFPVAILANGVLLAAAATWFLVAATEPSG